MLGPPPAMPAPRPAGMRLPPRMREGTAPYLDLVREQPSDRLWAPWAASSSTWREKPTLLQAAQRRLAFALGTLSGLECLADDLVLMVVERVKGEVGSLP